MDLKQLNYFVTVADEGSITAGAKKLFLSQPPLSTQLKALEEELGCTLLERGPRNITLTEPGKTLYTYAKTMLNLSRVAKEEVCSEADPAKGTVRIGMVSSLVCDRAMRWLADFSSQNPEINFEITEGNTYQLLEQLDAGALHFAMVRTPYGKGNRESFSLTADRIVAVGRASLFPKRKHLRTEDLEAVPLIVYRRWEATLKAAFSEKELKGRIRILADDARTAVKAAELGLGLALVPESAVEVLSEKDTVFLPIRDLNLLSTVEIVRIPGRYLPGCSQKLLTFLKEQKSISEGK